MENFIDLALKRQSTRKYSDKIIDRDIILKCIEAARIAPSASNAQPWNFIVVDDPKLVKEIAATTHNSVIRFNKFLDNVPVIVVLTMTEPQGPARIGRAIKKKDWPLIDIGIAASHFCLQAEELGLSTCMVGWFGEKKVKELLEIPKNENVALLFSIGYAPENHKQRRKIRKEIDEIAHFNSFKKS